MKLKKESKILLEEMKQYLPIPARPTKELYQYLRKKGIHIDMNRDLNIINVVDSGDMGGIMCAIEGDKKPESYKVRKEKPDKDLVEWVTPMFGRRNLSDGPDRI